MTDVEKNADVSSVGSNDLLGGIPRYGLQWSGPKSFVATPMRDGYWTPWHIAQAEIERMRAALVKIACPTQTRDLLWWQDEARRALGQEPDAIDGLLNEAADELAWLHRVHMGANPLSEGVPRITRLLKKIEASTGHATESPYPPPNDEAKRRCETASD